MSSGIQCEQLSVSLGTRNVLRDIDVDFPARAISLIVGPTGTGKSTLLHVIAGLVRPDSGTVSADGEPISRWTTEHLDRWRRNMGIVFQQPRLFEELNALENVMAPLVPEAKSLSAIAMKAEKALETAGLPGFGSRPVRELSVGERQRVSLARALSKEPHFLFADEPTAHQDDLGAGVVVNALLGLQKTGSCIVVTAHDPRLREHPAIDQEYLLESGRLRVSSTSQSP